MQKMQIPSNIEQTWTHFLRYSEVKYLKSLGQVIFNCVQFCLLNSRHGKKQSESSFLSGTKSLGRAQGLQYLRQGDAARNSYDEDWDPESDAKATTLSRNNSGRGSIRSLP